MIDELKFLSELELLKRKKREGFRTGGVERPHSIAEHSFIVAHLARIIAFHEEADVDKCMRMALCHDLGEARVGDHDKVVKKYCGRQIKEETEAIVDQVSVLEKKMGEEMISLFIEKEERKTKEAVVVQDADWLENALQCKIYLERGYKEFARWLQNLKDILQTETAKNLLKQLMEIENFVSYYNQ